MTEAKNPVLMSINDVQRQTGWSKPRIYDFAARTSDPLPLRYVDGTERGGVVVVAELIAWLDRNSIMYAERG